MTEKTIQIVCGDITKTKVDAIVNCGTSKVVIGGGSLDKAIHEAAGPDLRLECLRIMEEKRAICIGECVVSGAYKLPCKKVIHTAAPVFMGGGWHEAEHLASCYRNALAAADAAECTSIAFPCLSAGSHAYPKRDAAQIALETARSCLPRLMNVHRIVFVCLEEENYKIYTELYSGEGQ
ncbi:MAG: macro domain-containing protein [Spirochaetaceae bacterium]|jgi:O-acetyl-ADP-ribose deacetylase (regulator of RNase III)|nr:macro domain-containing protein [Spirochaetaceae bacterium]